MNLQEFVFEYIRFSIIMGIVNACVYCPGKNMSKLQICRRAVNVMILWPFMTVYAVKEIFMDWIGKGGDHS